MWASGIQSRNPHASLLAGAWSLKAGPDGLTLLRFAWADPDTGVVTNTFVERGQLGFALPVYRMYDWNRVYSAISVNCDSPPTPVLRPGMGCVLAVQGAFFAQFPFGAQATQRVWVNPADGTAYTADEGGYIESNFTAMEDCDCQQWAWISSFAGAVSQ